MCGEPDYCVLIWSWDVFKILCRVELGINEIPQCIYNFQISIANVSTDLMISVTGPNVFRYMKCNPDMSGVEMLHTQLNAADS